jgi:hypothetical protein
LEANRFKNALSSAPQSFINGRAHDPALMASIATVTSEASWKLKSKSAHFAGAGRRPRESKRRHMPAVLGQGGLPQLLVWSLALLSPFQTREWLPPLSRRTE